MFIRINQCVTMFIRIKKNRNITKANPLLTASAVSCLFCFVWVCLVVWGFWFFWGLKVLGKIIHILEQTCKCVDLSSALYFPLFWIGSSRCHWHLGVIIRLFVSKFFLEKGKATGTLGCCFSSYVGTFLWIPRTVQLWAGPLEKWVGWLPWPSLWYTPVKFTWSEERKIVITGKAKWISCFKFMSVR